MYIFKFHQWLQQFCLIFSNSRSCVWWYLDHLYKYLAQSISIGFHFLTASLMCLFRLGKSRVTTKMSINYVYNYYSQQRLNQTKYRELLAQRAQQFRTIQRRLLTRFKDKTPAPLANLDTLLDGTYRQVNFSGILLLC